MPSNALPGMQSKAIELTRLPRVAQDAKRCMAWGACQALDAIEGDQTHPFDSGSAGCQALLDLECNQKQSN
jgi:hypothetical protein